MPPTRAPSDMDAPYQYQYRLIAMAGSSSRVGAPGKLDSIDLPINEKEQDTLFIYRNGIASFEPMESEDKNLKPPGTKAWICEFLRPDVSRGF